MKRAKAKSKSDKTSCKSYQTGSFGTGTVLEVYNFSVDSSTKSAKTKNGSQLTYIY